MLTREVYNILFLDETCSKQFLVKSPTGFKPWILCFLKRKYTCNKEKLFIMNNIGDISFAFVVATALFKISISFSMF